MESVNFKDGMLKPEKCLMFCIERILIIGLEHRSKTVMIKIQRQNDLTSNI